jgi:hypothetical protein
VPGRGEVHGGAGAFLFGTQPTVDQPGAGAEQMSDPSEVLVQAHHDGRAAKRRNGSGGAQVLGARAEPDQGEPPAWDQPGDGNGAHCAGAFGRDEVCVASGASGGEQRGGLGDAGRADSGPDDFGRVGHVHFGQFGGGEGDHGPAPVVGEHGWRARRP